MMFYSSKYIATQHIHFTVVLKCVISLSYCSNEINIKTVTQATPSTATKLQSQQINVIDNEKLRRFRMLVLRYEWKN